MRISLVRNGPLVVSFMVSVGLVSTISLSGRFRLKFRSIAENYENLPSKHSVVSSHKDERTHLRSTVHHRYFFFSPTIARYRQQNNLVFTTTTNSRESGVAMQPLPVPPCLPICSSIIHFSLPVMLSCWSDTAKRKAKGEIFRIFSTKTSSLMFTGTVDSDSPPVALATMSFVRPCNKSCFVFF